MLDIKRTFNYSDIHQENESSRLNSIKVLMKKGEGPCISIFMPGRCSIGSCQDIKNTYLNLILKSEEWLSGGFLQTHEISDLLALAHKLLYNDVFWEQQSDGLGLFLARKQFLCFRVPVVFQELVVISKAFEVSPLMPALQANNYILYSGFKLVCC